MKKLFTISTLLLLASATMSARSFECPVSTDGTATLTVFLPDEGGTGRAIVACSGGGYTKLMMTCEGTDWADLIMRWKMPISTKENSISIPLVPEL